MDREGPRVCKARERSLGEIASWVFFFYDGYAMLILGLDPGYGRTGYGIVEAKGHALHAVAYGCIETKKETRFGERLVALKQKLDRLIAAHKPDRIAVEKLFFTKNAKTAIQVGEARGVAILSAAEADIAVVELTPNQVKQALTGYGSAEKGQVQRMVKVVLGLKDIPRPDDAADALAVAVAGVNIRA